jgi:hypothetical protein
MIFFCTCKRSETLDKVTSDRIEKITPSLEKFLELHPDEQAWLYPLLGRAEKRAIAIIEEIQGHPLTFEEIGKLTDTHPNTVKMTLYALERGGLAFRVASSKKWITPKGGRYRKLTKLN